MKNNDQDSLDRLVAVIERLEAFVEKQQKIHDKKVIRNKRLSIAGTILTLIVAWYSHDFFNDMYRRIISERNWHYYLFVESHNQTQAMELNRRLQRHLLKYETAEQINKFIKEQEIYFIKNVHMVDKHEAVEELFDFKSANTVSHQVESDSTFNIIEHMDSLK